MFGGVDRSLRAAINQHVYPNPEDWSVEDLFDKLGAFVASDRRFGLFLEGLASSDVLPDEAAQRVVAVGDSVIDQAGRVCSELIGNARNFAGDLLRSVDEIVAQPANSNSTMS